MSVNIYINEDYGLIYHLFMNEDAYGFAKAL